MDRTDLLLSIIDRLLNLVESNELKDALNKCEEFLEGVDEEDEEDDDEWEEVTETVVTPETKSQEVIHLENVIDHLCKAFGLEKVKIDGRIDVSYDPKVIDEVAKARKKL